MYQILQPNPMNFEIAGKAIRESKLVAVPSYTIYGIACNAFEPNALKRLRMIRNSPDDKPLTIVMDKDIIEEYAILTERERKIIDFLLPSPACVYVHKKDSRLDLATTYSDAICVLCQESEIGTLYKYSNTILAITSANKKNCPDANTVKQAINYFGDLVDIYIDGGAPRGEFPSAHLDIRKQPIELRRSAPQFPFEKIKNQLAQYGLK